MMKILEKIAEKKGYRLMRLPAHYNPELGYALHSYADYDSYKKIQTAGNKKKIDRVWALEDNIKFLAGVVKEKIPRPAFGLCHGSRRGLEQTWFAEALHCRVLGTDISDTAQDFPDTIQWDFHEVKPEWLGAVDFIYSNSFDHSYDPEKCLNAWMSCLKPGGLCIIEHSSSHGFSDTNELDPFGAELYQMPYLITSWGKGRYVVREILKAPRLNNEASHISFIIVQSFPAAA